MLAGSVAACGAHQEPADAAELDASPDGPVIDGPVDAPDIPIDAPDVPIDAPDGGMTPSSEAQTAGGGRSTSPGYHLQIRFGAPEPMGSASSPGYHIQLGGAR